MTEREAIECTYEDTCRICRRTSVTDPVTRQQRQTEVIIADTVRCALSKSSGSRLQFGDGNATVSGQPILFAAPEADIIAGDKIVITNAAGQVVTVWAGKPFIYANSHMEVPLLEEARA